MFEYNKQNKMYTTVCNNGFWVIFIERKIF